MERLAEYDVFPLPVKRIYYDTDFNCRNAFAPQSCSDLAASIQEHGLEFPVVVQPISDARITSDYDYRLIAGFRRFTAVTKFLKWETIPATIRAGLSERDARVLNLTENLERKDLNPLEEAQAIARVFPEGVSLREAAKSLKRDTRWVHVRLRLLTLPELVQKKVAAGLLTLLDVEFLCNYPSAESQIKAAEEMAKTRGSGRKLSAEYRRKFRTFRSKKDIANMNGYLMEKGLSGILTRYGAWCASYISDAEFYADIERFIETRCALDSAEPITDRQMD